jgi:tRNA threonylcarbamoyladenosine modification (KEOPS) complex Cgi121 subunit
MLYITKITSGHTLQTISAHVTATAAQAVIKALRAVESDLGVSYSIDAEPYGAW